MLPSWTDFSFSSLAMFFILAFRYLIVSALLYWLLWVQRPKSWESRRLHDLDPRKSKMRSEIKWSLWACLIFSIPSAFMIEMTKLGHTKVYLDPAEYGYGYLIISFCVYMFLHDTYFYWTHRLLHVPWVYRRFHMTHHESINPTPWTSFSFHPIESFIEAIIVPILVFIIPIHIGVLGVVLTLMTFFGVVNHTGYEIYPRSWLSGFWGEHWITPTNHNLHHTKFNGNYGLYFRFWDKIMKTEVETKSARPIDQKLTSLNQA